MNNSDETSGFGAGKTAGILTCDDGRAIAYRAHAGKSPTVVFLHGFRSDMSGGKALFLEDWAIRRNQGFLRFDATGHGLSSGRFEEGCIGDWAADAVTVLDRLTEGPVVLVGSSMGSWLMLLAALRRKERVAALLGLAAAPDFTEALIWAQASPEQRATLERDGVFFIHNPYEPDNPEPITRRLIEDGRRHLLLGGPIALDCPVRLIHGQRDADVPWQTSLRLTECLRSEDIAVTLVKKAGHRLSEPEDMALMERVLDALLERLACGASG